MIFDGFVHQLPDIDPTETQEWLDSLDAVVDTHGKTRARFLLSKLLDRASASQVSFPATVSTPYVNTIPREYEPWFPGDEHIERRIRAFIRWNAAMMVVKANKHADGIGGHLSTFASSASLYEIGFNHFFRGKDAPGGGDHVYFQGHAAPGIYARAYLEGRLTDDDLDHFRQEIGRGGRGLSSYPHPRLMPDFWEFPTVSMGLGPISALYHARFNRYLMNRHLDDTSESRVWCFIGDGECDEPETLGAISLASREQLDNLIFVVNCNLQRLDGPVRGNGKIIQELEAVFRGAGWNVIKVIWGSKWDELLAQDKDGVLLNKMNATVDGEFQRYAVESGEYAREHFFGPDPRLRQMVSHLSDEELRNLPRGGHDYRKLYAAYKAAVENLGSGRPTVILAKTIKGWTLGPGFEGRNATHQIKKMNKQQLLELRDRLHMHDEIPESALQEDGYPYFRPAEGSIEYQYMMERRRTLGGSMPRRTTTVPAPDRAAGRADVRRDARRLGRQRGVDHDGLHAPAAQPVPRRPRWASGSCRSSPTRGARSAWTRCSRSSRSTPARARSTSRSTTTCCCRTPRTPTGRSSRRASPRRARWRASSRPAPSYATRGVPMIPFYTFYSMFGFQRIGDLIWQAADMRARGFLMGATAGRTTLLGEGLQHQDGHSLLLASTVPSVQAYDPAFAYEVGAIVRVRHRAHVRAGHARRRARRHLLPHALQRELPDAGARPRAGDGGRGGRGARALPVRRRARRTVEAGDDPVLRHLARRRPGRQPPSSPSTTTSPPSCGRRPRTRSCARRRWRPSAGTASTRRRSGARRSSRSCSTSRRARSPPSATSCAWCPSRSAASCQKAGRSRCSAPTAWVAPTRARRCAGSSRSTWDTSSSAC